MAIFTLNMILTRNTKHASQAEKYILNHFLEHFHIWDEGRPLACTVVIIPNLTFSIFSIFSDMTRPTRNSAIPLVNRVYQWPQQLQLQATIHKLFPI